MTNGEFVTKWVVNTVKEQYPDDIALVISHSTLRINETEKTMSYFVPATRKGEEFAQTFILAGEGFDIWSISWERLEKFADLTEYNITCLADTEILYARCEADAKRFEELQKKQKENLSDKVKMRACALKAYAQAKNIYLDMLFATSDSDVKLGAGYVLDYLARAVAFTNLKYFKKSQSNQIEELKSMQNVPQGFEELYLSVIMEKNGAVQKKSCYELICMVQQFLLNNSKMADTMGAKEHNYQDLALWYAELSYTWLRLRRYAADKDTVKCYMWGIVLQRELNQVCGDFGLEKMELMEVFDADNLEALVNRANRLEQEMRTIIVAGGGKIREFETVEEFLNEI